VVLSFALQPSDPDFPFNLDGGLRCKLNVPDAYPANRRPSLTVHNVEMPKGFQINVEKGFDALAEKLPRRTLLSLMNELDRGLESILTSEKAQTIKIVANRGSMPHNVLVKATTSRATPLAELSSATTASQSTWTPQQIAEALEKRQGDVRQLEARLSRASTFRKDEISDRTIFIVPVQISRSARLPTSLQPVNEISLQVPKLYPLEVCTVHLIGKSSPEAQTIENAFEKHARDKSNMTLMAHINFLSQNIHQLLAQESVVTEPPSTAVKDLPAPEQMPSPSQQSTSDVLGIADENRPHIVIVPRPIEWDRQESDESSDESSSDSEEYAKSDADEEENMEGGAVLPTAPPTESGIHMSLPALELHGIELLVLVSLSLSVKCLRCKVLSEITNIRADESSTAQHTSTRHESCNKCTTPMTFSYSSNPLHANTIRAGTIEVTGCSVSDLLPSMFQPTCSSCSTTFPAPPGMMAVRGDVSIQVCRSCHAKMSFMVSPTLSGREVL
jgi:phage FluMu protein Com